MTDHADLGRRLALAIGYAPKDVRVRRVLTDPICEVRRIFLDGLPYWRFFDYRDPAIIWPIAERYRAFPVRTSDGVWHAYSYVGNTNDKGDTAAEAVARAVVGARG